MNIFVINSGSSSIKYQLFRLPSEKPVCSGLVERIGQSNAVIRHKTFSDDKEYVVEETLHLPNHEAGLERVVALLTNKVNGVIKNPDEIETVGHRVLHGGEKYVQTTLINEDVKNTIQSLIPLGPLHIPANLTGIEVAQKLFTKAKQVAVFDTAFHQTMPDYVFRYAIPNHLYTEHAIRVYGFHGTSHKYVTEKATKYLNNPSAKLISIHLGNGCSMAAVQNGKCIDTSMGFGPLPGLIMGTRSGDIDPSVIFFMAKELNNSIDQISDLLNKQSGMLGLTGSADMRDVNKQAENGNTDAKLALEMYAYRIKKYIGSYAAAMNGLDAIIFTAGVGENDNTMRKRICANLDFLGISIDDNKNNLHGNEIREINKGNTKIKVLIVPTNEELEIAKQCFSLLQS